MIRTRHKGIPADVDKRFGRYFEEGKKMKTVSVGRESLIADGGTNHAA